MSKITIELVQSTLTDAIASLPVPMTGQVSEFSSYKLSYADGTVSISSQNLVAYGCTTIETKGSASGQVAFLIEANRLKALTWKKQDTLTLIVDTESATIRAKGTRTQLSIELVEDNSDDSFDLDSYTELELVPALNEAAKFTSQDITRGSIACINWRANGDIFATDGTALFAANEPNGLEGFPEQGILIDTNQLSLWSKFEGTLHCKYNDARNRFDYIYTDGTTIIKSSVSKALYPDNPRALFPKGTETVEIDLKEFKSFSSAVKIVTPAQFEALILSNQDGKGSLTAKCEGVDMSMIMSEELPIADLQLGIKISLLKLLPRDTQWLRMVPNVINQPLLFETRKGYEIIIMPLILR